MTSRERVARITGAIFLPAGAIKFLAYGWELDNFRRFGLPAAGAWVVAAGVIELAGGVALLRGVAVRPFAALLAATMAVAIAVSGIKEGDVIPSLTVAPALLVACVWLLVTTAPASDGHGRRSRA